MPWGDLGGWHGLIILAVILLLFGASRLPALSKGLGQSIRIFRKEMSAPSDVKSAQESRDESHETAKQEIPTASDKNSRTE